MEYLSRGNDTKMSNSPICESRKVGTESGMERMQSHTENGTLARIEAQI